MKVVWFIRHGESSANAGLPTTDPGTIPLTSKGHLQAKALAKTIDEQPELIVVTPYLRTQQTARPTTVKFPDVPIEVWPLQEYDFLSPAQCVGTTVEDRKPWVRDYWNKSEATYVHGTGAESFIDFKGRVINGIKQLQNRNENLILVFVHGHVIRAICQYIQTSNENIDNQSMRYFRDKMSKLSVENTAIFKCEYDGKKWTVINPNLQSMEKHKGI